VLPNYAFHGALAPGVRRSERIGSPLRERLSEQLAGYPPVHLQFFVGQDAQVVRARRFRLLLRTILGGKFARSFIRSR